MTTLLGRGIAVDSFRPGLRVLGGGGRVPIPQSGSAVTTVRWWQGAQRGGLFEWGVGAGKPGSLFSGFLSNCSPDRTSGLLGWDAQDLQKEGSLGLGRGKGNLPGRGALAGQKTKRERGREDADTSQN